MAGEGGQGRKAHHFHWLGRVCASETGRKTEAGWGEGEVESGGGRGRKRRGADSLDAASSCMDMAQRHGPAPQPSSPSYKAGTTWPAAYTHAAGVRLEPLMGTTAALALTQSLNAFVRVRGLPGVAPCPTARCAPPARPAHRLKPSILDEYTKDRGLKVGPCLGRLCVLAWGPVGLTGGRPLTRGPGPAAPRN